MSFLKPAMPASEAARAGALSGLIGGVAMLAARRLQEEGLLRRGETAEMGWDQLLEAESRRHHLRLTKRELWLAGVGVHIAYSMLVGAMYGVARSRRRIPAGAKGSLSSALAYAAHAPSRILRPPKRRQARSTQRKNQVKKELIPIGTQMIFGVTTGLVFKLLSRNYELD